MSEIFVGMPGDQPQYRNRFIVLNYQNVFPFNVSDILAELPDAFVEYVKSVADSAPTADDEWADC